MRASSVGGVAGAPGSQEPRRVRCQGQGGFTLIELMMVTLILGLIAAIALPKFDNARAQAHFSVISGDLRNLGVSQVLYHQSHSIYAVDVGDLNFQSSQGVEIEVTEASESGWAAVATHVSLDVGAGCSLYLGDVSPPPLPNGQPRTSGPGVTECAR